MRSPYCGMSANPTIATRHGRAHAAAHGRAEASVWCAELACARIRTDAHVMSGVMAHVDAVLLSTCTRRGAVVQEKRRLGLCCGPALREAFEEPGQPLRDLVDRLPLRIVCAHRGDDQSGRPAGVACHCREMACVLRLVGTARANDAAHSPSATTRSAFTKRARKERSTRITVRAAGGWRSI